MSEAMYFAHPSAVIDAPCKIGDGTRIWHFCHIMAHSSIGRNCTLGMNVFVERNVRIGDGVKIQNNVSVYEGVILEDDVFCGPSAVFTNVINPRSHIPRKDEFKQTLVKRGATIGANATIVCGITIGCFAMVGAGAVVTRSVPDFSLVYGTPARIHGWMCKCGVGLGTKTGPACEVLVCPACGTGYKKEGTIIREARI